MKEKFEKLRDLASDVSDTTVEDGNTYTILSLCDQLVDAIDTYLEDQEENKHWQELPDEPKKEKDT